VFTDERLDKNSLVVFRCHVEETQQWSALEIPEWMFDAGCNRMLLVDKPLVTCEALSRLKVLLAGASNDDPTVKEAQRFEGGVDASDTESKTTTVGIVPSVNSDPSLDSNPIGGETKDHPVPVTIVTATLAEPTRPPKQGGRR
jgi:hypothetical protein